MKFPCMIAGLVACAALLRLQAAPATWQFQQGPNHLQILHQARPLLLYVFTNTQFKPYVKELCTLQGTNVLLDAPADHLHHHGLMLAFKVNDINFWEESPTAGVQVAIAWPGPAKDRCVAFIDQRGEAVLAQRLAWLPQAHRHDPDPRPAALLTEERILRLRVHPELQEVSLEWHSTFTTGSTTNVFRISGAGYHGLGLRPLPSFNRVARRLNPIGAAYSPEARWDVVGGEWGALVGPVNGGEITLTLFNHPLNTAPPMFFSMLNAFAYLSATQALDQQPQTYRAGESFTLRYLVTLHQGARTVDFLNSRAFLKAAPRN